MSSGSLSFILLHQTWALTIICSTIAMLSTSTDLTTTKYNLLPKRHNYPTASITSSAFFVLYLTLIAGSLIGPTIWMGSQNLGLFLTLFTLLYSILYPFFSRSDKLKRFFMNEKQIDEDVKEGAITAFFSEQLYKTENENGVLLYISVVEQKVWILGDRNINARIDQRVWDDMVQKLTKGIRQKDRCEAICDTITQIGETPKVHFPAVKNDRDELHNIIIR